jgi:16S rRNA (uracil1498-N3)-methyltransferase
MRQAQVDAKGATGDDRTMRRVHVDSLEGRVIELDGDRTHHLKTVLRLAHSATVEVFDTIGRVAEARIEFVGDLARLVISSPIAMRPPGRAINVACAVPKGERADWLVEKLCEVGASTMIPLRTARSVVHPEGQAKYERWRRIASEAARQSCRAGVMSIEPLTGFDDLLHKSTHTLPAPTLLIAHTAPDAGRLGGMWFGHADAVWLLIGPEGGWTDDEVASAKAHGAIEVSITDTVLRVETAAVVGAGLIASASDEEGHRSA